jgi:predicted dehydrogenase
MKPVRIAMLGSGFVADFYMQGLADVRNHEVAANYSRSASRAETLTR